MKTFLLGAGASRAEGIPLTAEIIPTARSLLGEAKKLRELYRAGRWASPDYAYAMITPAEHIGIFDQRYIDAFEDVLRLSESIGVSADVEDIACVLDSGTGRRELSREWTELELSRARTSLDAVLAFVLHCGRVNTTTGELEFHSPYNLHLRLGRTVGQDDAVLTLNYDYAADYALGEETPIAGQSRAIDYGFEREFLRFVDYPPRVRQDWPGPGRLLLHLHGSLGWLYCEECNIVTSIIDPNDFSGGWDLNSTLFLPQADAKAERMALCSCGGRVKPLMVSPALHKRYDNPIIGRLWSAAAAVLRRTDELICIGCSFRPNDDHLFELLTSCASRISRVECVTFRSDAAFEARVRAIFPSAVILEGGFEGYLARLPAL